MVMNPHDTKDNISLSTQNGVDNPDISPSKSPNMLEYRVYPERWWLLSAVLLLNISNYAHWVAFPVVVKVNQENYLFGTMYLNITKNE